MGFHCLDQNGIQQEFGLMPKVTKWLPTQHRLELIHTFEWWCRKASRFRLKLAVSFSEIKCLRCLCNLRACLRMHVSFPFLDKCCYILYRRTLRGHGTWIYETFMTGSLIVPAGNLGFCIFHFVYQYQFIKRLGEKAHMQAAILWIRLWSSRWCRNVR